MASLPQSDPITEVLKNSRTIAVVGSRATLGGRVTGCRRTCRVRGTGLFQWNPNIEECLGEKAYGSLPEVKDKIDIVNIFRRPEFVEAIVDQAIQLKVPAIWMQEDVIHEKAAEKARLAGIFVMMDSCILKEHRARVR